MKFPAIFHLVLTVSGEFQHGWVAGARDRQDSGFKFKRERHRDVLGQSKSLNWLNLQQTPLFSTTELCSHSQPSQDWPSFHVDTMQVAHTDHHCASENSHAANADHLSVVCSLFMYDSVHGEK